MSDFCADRLARAERKDWPGIPPESAFSSAPLDGTETARVIAETVPEANRGWRRNMLVMEMRARAAARTRYADRLAEREHRLN